MARHPSVLLRRPIGAETYNIFVEQSHALTLRARVENSARMPAKRPATPSRSKKTASDEPAGIAFAAAADA